MRFGHEGADAGMQVGALTDDLAPARQDRLAQIGNRLHIFDGFRGVPDHEIELDGLPAALVNGAGHVEQVLRSRSVC